MSEAASIISAIAMVLAPVGGGGAFVWKRLEARFKAIEAKLEACEDRERRSQNSRGRQWTIIQLLLNAIERVDPPDPAVTRAKELLQELRARDAQSEKD